MRRQVTTIKINFIHIKKTNRNIILFLMMFMPYASTSQICENVDTIVGVETEIHGNHKNDDYKKNTVYFELGGNGVVYSINYDRTLWQSNKRGLSIATGFCTNFRFNGFFFPQQINFFYGTMHRLEFGLGYTFEYYAASSDYIYYTNYVFSRIGYRYQKKEGGFFFRIGFTPYFTDRGFGYYTEFFNFNSYFMPFIGVGLYGYTF